jgi:L-aspartate oxidase
MKTLDCDFLVIGSGVAGLVSALHLAKHGQVFLVSKRAGEESNSTYAQGGIACVMSDTDCTRNHVEDTLRTGCGLSHEDVVEAIVEGGYDRIRELEKLGVSFERWADGTSDEYDLGKEGGHSKRRILHAGDITGAEMVRVLLRRAKEEPNIKMIENWLAVDLVPTDWIKAGNFNRNVGAYFFNRDEGEMLAVRSPVTVLATGGLGKVYLYTSNPDVATGDGVAMAWRAGLPIRNMEFIQFHPTCLYHPNAKSFLISEAVRGEGAELLDMDGNAFMKEFEMGSLSTRDVTARAIDSVMKRRGDPYVLLDITHKSKEFLMTRFPNLYNKCLSYGIDMATDPIPVVPAAHYSCGGIAADVNGITPLPGVYAVGEVASTGLHGANRLASNSLLEALVCGHNAAKHIIENLDTFKHDTSIEIPEWKSGTAVLSDEAVVVEHDWNELRSVMWDFVGIVRSDRRLARALTRVQTLRDDIRSYYKDYIVTDDLLELRNLADVAALIIRSSISRKESRGLHYTLDYPGTSDTFDKDTVIQDSPGRKTMGA